MTWLLIKNYNNGDVTNVDNNNEEENNEDRYLLLECVCSVCMCGGLLHLHLIRKRETFELICVPFLILTYAKEGEGVSEKAL